MGLRFDGDDSNTPIDPDESEGLIPSLSTQAELNEFELLNIAEAMGWAERSGRVVKNISTVEVLRQLHRRMFGKTWTWAGQFRKTQKTIGIEAYRISTELHNLLEDVKVWIESGSYPPEEIVARFHHRLVLIHPFPNGNGRHARLAADILCVRQGWPVSEWGASNLGPASQARSDYIAALKRADEGDIQALVKFMANTR